jgi:hypothetical protein
MLLSGMLLSPGRLARAKDFIRASDVIIDPDDPLGWMAWPRQMRELAQRSLLMDNDHNLIAAASVDCEWNGGPMK